jgi:HEAT repeat protein
LIKQPEKYPIAFYLPWFRDERLVEPISNLLASGKAPANDRSQYINALGATRDPRALPALVAVLTNRNSPNAEKQEALQAIANLRDASAALDVLLPLAQDKDNQTRMFALLALGSTHNPKAIDCLIANLKSGNSYVRSMAIFGLACIDDPRAITAAARAVGSFDDMLTNYGTGEEVLRWALLHNPKLSVEDLIAILNQQEASSYWRDAMEALGKTKDPRGLKAMINLLNECSMSIEEQMIAAFASYGTAGVDALLTALSTSDNKGQLVEILGSLGDSRAIEPLMALAKDDEQGEIPGLMEALARLKARDALPFMLKRASSRDESTRLDAIIALGIMRDPQGVDVLLRR